MYGDMFMSDLNRYSNPYSTGTAFPGVNPLAGIPGMDNPFAAMGAQMYLLPKLQQQGFMFTGFGDQNVMDIMQQRRMFQQQQLMLQQTGVLQQDNIYRTVAGSMRAAGVQMGPEQEALALGTAKNINAISPFLAMMRPDILEAFSGARGSSMVLGTQMMMAARTQIDPITGLSGMRSGTYVGKMANDLYEQMYAGTNYLDMKGISAGKAGQLYYEMNLQGKLPAFASQRDALMAVGGTTTVQDEARRLNLTDKSGKLDISRLTPQGMDSLLGSEKVQGEVRAVESGRIKDKLKEMSGTVSALTDLFGAMGQPDAPMQVLMQALEKLTASGSHMIKPEQAQLLIRNFKNLAEASGAGIDAASALQQGVAAQLAAGGLPGVMSLGITNSSLAWQTATRGMFANNAFGSMNQAQRTEADATLRAGAAKSEMAMRMGAALYLGATTKLDEGSDAQRYVQALKDYKETGTTTWVDRQGNTRNLAISQSELNTMFAGKMDPSGLRQLMQSRVVMAEHVNAHGVQDIVRSDQKRDVLRGLTAQTQAAVGGAHIAINAKKAEAIAAAVMGLDDDTATNDEKRSEAITKILEKQLGPDAVDRMRKAGHSVEAVASSLYARFDPYLRDNFGGKGYHDSRRLYFDKNAQEQQRQRLVTARTRSQLEDTLAGFAKGKGIQAVITKIQEGSSDTSLLAMIGEMTGEKDKDIQGKILEHIRAIDTEGKAYQDRVSKHYASRPKDPGPNATQAERAEFNKQVADWNVKSPQVRDMGAYRKRVSDLEKLTPDKQLTYVDVNKFTEEERKQIADKAFRDKFLDETVDKWGVSPAGGATMTEDQRRAAKRKMMEERLMAGLETHDADKAKAVRKELGLTDDKKLEMYKAVVAAEQQGLTGPKPATGAGGQVAFPEKLILTGTLLVKPDGTSTVNANATADPPVQPATPSAPAASPPATSKDNSESTPAAVVETLRSQGAPV